MALTIENLSDVQEALWEARHRWFNIGVQLRLKAPDLTAIDHEQRQLEEKFTKMIMSWLQSGQQCTWRALSKALQEGTVGLPGLAQRIKAKCGSDKSGDESADDGAVEEKEQPRASNALHSHDDAVTSLPDSYQSDVQLKLYMQSCEMSRQFTALANKTEGFLMKENIPVERLISCISPSNDDTSKSVPHIADHLDTAHSVSRVFIILKQKGLMSFINYKIMVPIIQDLCENKELTEELKKYEDKFREYVKRRVCESSVYKSHRFQPGDNSHPIEGNELLIITDHSWNAKRSLEELLHLKIIVAEVCKVESFRLALQSVESKCLRLHFYLSNGTGMMIFPLSHVQEDKLRKSGIAEVHYKEYHYVLNKVSAMPVSYAPSVGDQQCLEGNKSVGASSASVLSVVSTPKYPVEPEGAVHTKEVESSHYSLHTPLDDRDSENCRLPQSCGWDLKGSDAQGPPEYLESISTCRNSPECHDQHNILLEQRIREHEEKIREQEQKIGEQEQKIGEQEQKIGEQEQKIREQEQKIQQQEQKIGEQEHKIGEQEQKIGEQEQKIGEQEQKIGEQEQKIGEQEQKTGEQEQKIREQEQKIGEQEQKIGEQEQKIGEQEQKIREQEEEMRLKEEKIRRQEDHIREQQSLLEIVNPMDDISRQYDGQYDQLIREYGELMTNPDGVLGQLEEEFEDPLDAEVALGHVVMAAYEESKQQIIDYMAQKLQKLFVVQNEEGTEHSREMKDLSRAFGLLLSTATNCRSQSATSSITSKMCEMIQKEMLEMEPYKRPKKKLDRFPVQNIVQLMWKFVTIPKPIIICQPTDFDPNIHERLFHLWNAKEKQPYQLFHVRPVVYRNYNGLVGSKGLVGNDRSMKYKTF